MSVLTDIVTVARYALREAVRRRVFHAAVVLGVLFVVLYVTGLHLFWTRERNNLLDHAGRNSIDPIVAPTLFGLSLFGTHFLATALVVLLTMSTVRGDAERGLLQQLVVRPLGRAAYLGGRLLAALALGGGYIACTYGLTLWATHHIAHWSPASALTPLLLLLLSLLVTCVLTILGSTRLAGPANGIIMFMLLGIGMLGGLINQLGSAFGSQHMHQLGVAISYAVPSEALYQGALFEIGRNESGVGGVVLRLGPLGGSQAAGTQLPIWVGFYVLATAALAAWAFRRRDI